MAFKIKKFIKNILNNGNVSVVKTMEDSATDNNNEDCQFTNNDIDVNKGEKSETLILDISERYPDLLTGSFSVKAPFERAMYKKFLEKLGVEVLDEKHADSFHEMFEGFWRCMTNHLPLPKEYVKDIIESIKDDVPHIGRKSICVSKEMAKTLIFHSSMDFEYKLLDRDLRMALSIIEKHQISLEDKKIYLQFLSRVHKLHNDNNVVSDDSETTSAEIVCEFKSVLKSFANRLDEKIDTDKITAINLKYKLAENEKDYGFLCAAQNGYGWTDENYEYASALINSNINYISSLYYAELLALYYVQERSIGREISELLPDEILLLGYLEGRNSNLTGIPGYFSYVYGLNINETVQKLLDMGYLQSEVNLPLILNKSTVAKLTTFLNSQDTKCKGKKQEIIDFIISNFDEETITEYFTDKFFKLTPKGNEIWQKNNYLKAVNMDKSGVYIFILYYYVNDTNFTVERCITDIRKKGYYNFDLVIKSQTENSCQMKNAKLSTESNSENWEKEFNESNKKASGVNFETVKLDWIRKKTCEEQIAYFGGGKSGEIRKALLDENIIANDKQLELLYKTNDKGRRVLIPIKEIKSDESLPEEFKYILENY